MHRLVRWCMVMQGATGVAAERGFVKKRKSARRAHVCSFLYLKASKK